MGQTDRASRTVAASPGKHSWRTSCVSSDAVRSTSDELPQLSSSVPEIEALPRERGDRLVARTGFDQRALATPYRWFRISPRRIQAWREVNELSDRELMHDGRWLV
jgi:hypothetical protein